MNHCLRCLSPEMQKAFTQGVLNPLLEAVKQDRDLILEFRSADEASIYCKGHCIEIKACGEVYSIHAHEKFLEQGPEKLRSVEDAEKFVGETLPKIKQK